MDVTATQPISTDWPFPFVELDNADPELLAELIAVVADVARRAAFTLGDEVEAFEREFAAYCGAREAVGVSSGTEALVLALRALEIGPGDEVVVPANTFIATAEAVTLVGARPRVVDVDPATGLLTPALVEEALGARTRCVIPVHLYGATADVEGIVAVARRAGVAVVEDACQAHGARIGDRRAGTVGDLGCFSFYPTKNLGGWGDGGAVVTSDPELAGRVRLLRSHGEGAQERHRHRLPGSTARLDGIQAAVLRVKLRRLERANDERRCAGRRDDRAPRRPAARAAVGAARRRPRVPPLRRPGVRARRAARRGWRPSRSPRRSTTRCRSTAPRPTSRSGWAAAASPSPNGWPARSARCRSGPRWARPAWTASAQRSRPRSRASRLKARTCGSRGPS